MATSTLSAMPSLGVFMWSTQHKGWASELGLGPACAWRAILTADAVDDKVWVVVVHRHVVKSPRHVVVVRVHHNAAISTGVADVGKVVHFILCTKKTQQHLRGCELVYACAACAMLLLLLLHHRYQNNVIEEGAVVGCRRVGEHKHAH